MAFLLDPRNLHRWVSDAELEMTPRGNGEWLIVLPQGPRIVSFEAPNEFGVVDHAFYEEGTAPQVTPTRVFPNGEGAELTYTIFQTPGMTDEQFASIATWTETDFMALKSWLEAV